MSQRHAIMDGAIEQQLDSELVALEEATAPSLAAFAQTSMAKPESRELMQTIQGNMATMRAKTRDLELLAEELDTCVYDITALAVDGSN